MSDLEHLFAARQITQPMLAQIDQVHGFGERITGHVRGRM